MTAVYGRWNGKLPEAFQPPQPEVSEDEDVGEDESEGIKAGGSSDVAI
jgi:hypothetical protein